MMWQVKHRRADGSFVINKEGLPYHVVPVDALFAAVALAAEAAGTLPDEPVPTWPGGIDDQSQNV